MDNTIDLSPLLAHLQNGYNSLKTFEGALTHVKVIQSLALEVPRLQAKIEELKPLAKDLSASVNSLSTANAVLKTSNAALLDDAKNAAARYIARSKAEADAVLAAAVKEASGIISAAHAEAESVAAATDKYLVNARAELSTKKAELGTVVATLDKHKAAIAQFVGG